MNDSDKKRVHNSNLRLPLYSTKNLLGWILWKDYLPLSAIVGVDDNLGDSSTATYKSKRGKTWAWI